MSFFFFAYIRPEELAKLKKGAAKRKVQNLTTAVQTMQQITTIKVAMMMA